jgi:hypothetical protein
LLVGSACQSMPSLPNPFRSDSTAVPKAGAAPSPSAQPQAAFTPFWVQNHQLTDMWSGQAGQAGVVSFGTTTNQFCSFQVVRPPEGERLYVLNPHSGNYLWIDASAVGPIPSAPERRPGPKPADQNCSDVIHDG